MTETMTETVTVPYQVTTREVAQKIPDGTPVRPLAHHYKTAEEIAAMRPTIKRGTNEGQRGIGVVLEEEGRGSWNQFTEFEVDLTREMYDEAVRLGAPNLPAWPDATATPEAAVPEVTEEEVIPKVYEKWTVDNFEDARRFPVGTTVRLTKNDMYPRWANPDIPAKIHKFYAKGMYDAMLDMEFTVYRTEEDFKNNNPYDHMAYGQAFEVWEEDNEKEWAKAAEDHMKILKAEVEFWGLLHKKAQTASWCESYEEWAKDVGAGAFLGGGWEATVKIVQQNAEGGTIGRSARDLQDFMVGGKAEVVEITTVAKVSPKTKRVVPTLDPSEPVDGASVVDPMLADIPHVVSKEILDFKDNAVLEIDEGSAFERLKKAQDRWASYWPHLYIKQASGYGNKREIMRLWENVRDAGHAMEGFNLVDANVTEQMTTEDMKKYEIHGRLPRGAREYGSIGLTRRMLLPVPNRGHKAGWVVTENDLKKHLEKEGRSVTDVKIHEQYEFLEAAANAIKNGQRVKVKKIQETEYDPPLNGYVVTDPYNTEKRKAVVLDPPITRGGRTGNSRLSTPNAWLIDVENFEPVAAGERVVGEYGVGTWEPGQRVMVREISGGNRIDPPIEGVIVDYQMNKINHRAVQFQPGVNQNGSPNEFGGNTAIPFDNSWFVTKSNMAEVTIVPVVAAPTETGHVYGHWDQIPDKTVVKFLGGESEGRIARWHKDPGYGGYWKFEWDPEYDPETEQPRTTTGSRHGYMEMTEPVNWTENL